MDKYDPNTWTARYVLHNIEECAEFLKETTQQVIQYVRTGNYPAAVSGLDRILNGLIVIYNAKVVDCSSEISYFSCCEGSIIAFGIDAPEHKRREVAIAMFEDGRDFADDRESREMWDKVAKMLKSGCSFYEVKKLTDPHFPADTIKLLESLHNCF